MKEKISIKIKRMIKAVIEYLPSFGWGIFVAQERCIISGNSEKSMRYKNEKVMKYLKKSYSYLIDKYAYEQDSQSNYGKQNNVIWVFWWQGVESMPDIIRMCYQSQLRNAHGNQLILLNKDNIKEYVELPDSIWEQFENGRLKIQHLADIIRVTLIKNYGGLWLDASIYCSEMIPDYCFESPIYSLRTQYISGKSSYNISLNRWTTFLIGGQKGNTLCSFLYDFFLEYCAKEKFFVDYFLFDCAIALAYENIMSVKKEIDDLPIVEKDYYFISEHFDQKMDNDLLEAFHKKCFMFNKVKWGLSLSELPDDSLYHYLKEGKILEKS